MLPLKDPPAPHHWQARGGTLQRGRARLAAGPCMGAVLLLSACSATAGEEPDAAVPAGEVRDALSALCAYVATRTS